MSVTTIYKIALVIVLLLVIFELGRALYFMMTGHDRSGDRMVWALTRRVAFAVLLIALIVIGIVTGILQPHGIYVR
jgi:uncharacterized membrane protein